MNIQPIVNYGGFAVGVISLLLTIFFYFRSIESKDPRCYYLTYQDIKKLEGQGQTKIRLLYGDEDVEQVFTTYVWLWNAGKKPIQKEDIPEKAPLYVKLSNDNPELKILDYKVTKVSRDAIEFSTAKLDQTTLAVRFGFLDQKDGALIEIQHTGNDETTITIGGIILGVPRGFTIRKDVDKVSPVAVNASKSRNFPKIDVVDKILYSLSFLLVVGGGIFFIWMSFSMQGPEVLVWVTRVFSIVMTLGFAIDAYLKFRRDYPTFPDTLSFDTSQGKQTSMQKEVQSLYYGGKERTRKK